MAVATCCGVVLSCGGDGTSPVDNTPATITITPSATLSLQSGATATLTAAAANKDGRPVNASVIWSTSDATIAAVSSGVVTAIKVGSATITAATGTITASVSVTVSPGAASQLAIRNQPGGGPIGNVLGVQPVVEIHDAAGNVVTASSAPVTAAIGSGGGTLSGQTTVNAVAGVATFTGLSIAGTAGDRTLAFTAAGLAGTTSLTFTMTPPAVPIIAVDSTSVTFVATVGANPAAKTTIVRDAGGAPFTTVTVDPPAYDAGQPTGWLSATITQSGNTSFGIALSVTSAALALGTYHATLHVNAAGAPNSPASVSVSLTVTPVMSVTYGSSAQKIALLDVGASLAPTITILIGGQAQPPTSATYISRATTVATVGADGRITAVGSGQSWVVALLQFGQGDSIFVMVTRAAAGPVLHADLTNYAVRAGDTTTLNVTLDPRTSGLAAANVVVGYETENSMFTIVSASIPNQTPMPTGSFSSPGVFKGSVASGTALTSPVIMLTLKVVTPRSNLSGWFTLTVLDAVAADGTVLTAQATSTRYPVIVQ